MPDIVGIIIGAFVLGLLNLLLRCFYHIFCFFSLFVDSK